VRQATYDTTLISLIRQYRQDKDFATYSGKKLAIVFKRDYPDRPEFHYSGATLGRIITTYKLFFTEVVKAAKERSKRALATWKKRKPAGLHNVLADAPRKLIEFDMKHIYAGGKKYYAFCAIDVYTREALLHVASTSTSRQARIALEKVVDVFGRNITLLNDNGSENHGEAYSYLKDTNITQYFARPRQPKDKPYIERLIGSYQRECLDQYRADITTLEDLDYYTTRWTNNYHYTRPHDSLNGKTPDEFCATLNITIERRKVSTR
jgi:transposase InsO family protein